MKKVTTFLAAMFVAISGFAQLIIWDGEENNVDWWGDSSPSVVVNEDTEGINIGGNCLKYESTGDTPIKRGFNTDLEGRKRLSFMIKRNGSGNVKVEIAKDGTYWEKVIAWYDGNGVWQKLVFDFSTNNIDNISNALTIWADLDNNNIGTVYIDNVVVEDIPTVNGIELSNIQSDELQNSTSLTLGGAWMSGESTNVTGEWQKVEYNDFATLQTKLTGNTILTSVDMTAVSALKNPYYIYENINPNCLVYANQWAGDHNVIINGEAERVWLYDARSFNCPVAFKALDITYTRECYMDGGWETIVLPFNSILLKKVVGDDQVDMLDNEYVIETFDGKDTDYVYFKDADGFTANLPSIFKLTEGVAGNEEKQVVIFCGANQDISATNEIAFNDIYKGTFNNVTLQGDTGYYLLNTTGDAFSPASEDGFTILAFHAYLDTNLTQGAPTRVYHGANPTDIDTEKVTENELVIYTSDNVIIIDAIQAQLVKVYSIDGCLVRTVFVEEGKTTIDGLTQGVYIVNNHKVVVR